MTTIIYDAAKDKANLFYISKYSELFQKLKGCVFETNFNCTFFGRQLGLIQVIQDTNEIDVAMLMNKTITD